MPSNARLFAPILVTAIIAFFLGTLTAPWEFEQERKGTVQSEPRESQVLPDKKAQGGDLRSSLTSCTTDLDCILVQQLGDCCWGTCPTEAINQRFEEEYTAAFNEVCTETHRSKGCPGGAGPDWELCKDSNRATCIENGCVAKRLI